MHPTTAEAGETGQVLPSEITNQIISPPGLPQGIEEGILLIDKPFGWTSFDVIRRLRRALRIRKIGHSGTLDPMATGLLICCFGRMTKKIPLLVGLDKSYEGTIRLGESTETYDAEGEIVDRRPWRHVTREMLSDARHFFTGRQEQLPPMFSAVKVGGERLYKKARRGETVQREPRSVEIKNFDIIDVRLPEVDFTVTCSKGTYIRSLAHDFGERLGSGAHLSRLRRTRVGTLHVDDAWTLSDLVSAGGEVQ